MSEIEVFEKKSEIQAFINDFTTIKQFCVIVNLN